MSFVVVLFSVQSRLAVSGTGLLIRRSLVRAQVEEPKYSVDFKGFLRKAFVFSGFRVGLIAQLIALENGSEVALMVRP